MHVYLQICHSSCSSFRFHIFTPFFVLLNSSILGLSSVLLLIMQRRADWCFLAELLAYYRRARLFITSITFETKRSREKMHVSLTYYPSTSTFLAMAGVPTEVRRIPLLRILLSPAWKSTANWDQSARVITSAQRGIGSFCIIPAHYAVHSIRPKGRNRQSREGQPLEGGVVKASTKKKSWY